MIELQAACQSFGIGRPLSFFVPGSVSRGGDDRAGGIALSGSRGRDRAVVGVELRALTLPAPVGKGRYPGRNGESRVNSW